MIIFDSKTHTYFIDGEKTPSVTQIIQDAGLVDGSEFFKPHHAARGTLVHRATDALDRGIDTSEQHDPEVEPYLKSYKRFLKECSPTYEEIEKIKVIRELKVAGTVDRSGTIFGEKAVIDIKTGIKARWHGIQLAAYAWDRQDFKRYTLHLKTNGKYILIEHSDKQDFLVFKSAAILYHYKKGTIWN